MRELTEREDKRVRKEVPHPPSLSAMEKNGWKETLSLPPPPPPRLSTSFKRPPKIADAGVRPSNET